MDGRGEHRSPDMSEAEDPVIASHRRDRIALPLRIISPYGDRSMALLYRSNAFVTTADVITYLGRLVLMSVEQDRTRYEVEVRLPFALVLDGCERVLLGTEGLNLLEYVKRGLIREDRRMEVHVCKASLVTDEK